MSISEIKVWPLKKDHPKIKANVQFVVDNTWKIKGTLMAGEKGLFVGLPGKYGEQVDPKTGKKPWWPDISCVNKEAQQQLNEEVVKAYNKITGNRPSNQDTQDSSPEDQTPTQRSNIPFG